MITSGSRNEPKNDQQAAGHSQSSCSIREIARELAAMGLHQQAGRAILGVLHQVDGGRPAPSAIARVTKVGLSGTPHTRKPFEPRMRLKTGKLYETSDPVRFHC